MKNKQGWLLVSLSFFIYFVCDGLTFSFGLIFVDILGYFGRSTSRTSLIASFINCLPLLYSPFVCYLIARFGFQKCTILAGLMIFISFCISFFVSNFHLLQLVYGFILTFGFSISYLCAYTILPYWFDRNMPLAAGITVSGSGIGQASFSFLIQYLLEYYGWQGTSLIVGGISLNIAVLGYLYRVPDKLPISERKITSKLIVDKFDAGKKNARYYYRKSIEILCIRQIWLFFVVNFFLMMAFSTPYVFLADYIKSHNIHLSPAIPYALMGISTTISQFLLGWAANKRLVSDWMLYSLTMFLSALSSLLPVIWPYSRAACIIHAVAFATFISPSYVLMITLLIECAGDHNLDISLGYTQIFQGLASLIGLPICGLLKDRTGDYIWSYIFTAISLFISSILMILWPMFKKTKSSNMAASDNSEHSSFISG
ncbi:hypothetical protein GJ496_005420 [Pomphorhynchus laevis]|nr:hypothetical protein GJ496_005420 [Pomphorhynchus laevis]